MGWDPNQYLKFADERFRPAYDLITQIPLQSPSLIYDLGCGTGHLTLALAERWPKAKIIGFDSSEEMLKVASTLTNTIQWEQQDINNWKNDTEKADLIFSNSVLHWLGNHEVLFEKLLSNLKTPGVLAIQMPNNFKEPTHTLAFKIINENNEWKNKFLSFLNYEPVHDFNYYYKIFGKPGLTINAWQTVYYHVLSGKNPVVEWVKGSFLKPLLDQMSADNRTTFLDKYAKEILINYPEQANGKTILPFKRLFLIVTKS